MMNFSCHGTKYTFTCQEGASPATEGQWTWAGPDEAPLPSLVDDSGLLVEAACNAQNLTLTNYDAQVSEGMEIQCVEGGAGQVKTRLKIYHPHPRPIK